MKFIGDDVEEVEELMTWIVSMLKYAFVLIFPDCFFALILLINGRFYTRGRIMRLNELGQTFVIRLVIRL